MYTILAASLPSPFAPTLLAITRSNQVGLDFAG